MSVDSGLHGNVQTGLEGVDVYPAEMEPVAPICSICIANYNGVHLLDDCLQSIAGQGEAIPVEIIVHDDASTDGSLALLRERYPNVAVLASRVNVGFCIANNRMVTRAKGKFVLLLNNDAALQAGALVALVEASAAATQPRILTLPQYDWSTGVLVDRGCMLDLFYNPVPNLNPARHQVAITIGACLFLPRNLWGELGGFPEWMGSLAEDMYLCCLARLYGLVVQVTPQSGYLHRQGASFGGNRVESGRLNTTFRRRLLSERNKTAVMVICTPSSFVWPLLVMHATSLFVEGIVLSLLKRDLQVWRKIYQPTLAYIWTNLGTLRRRRQEVQRHRRTSFRAYMRDVVLFPRKLSMLKKYGLPKIR